MTDYVLINGVDSRTITGMMVSELPEISKPKIRTEKTEIDGKDGDELVDLGYSSYNKQIEVGLFGSYNIDEVISYFNSKGKITFSNEPDKYYRFKIYEQIDFERIIKFGKGKIKIHVQPFKYALSESEEIFTTFETDEYTNKYVEITNSGNYHSKPIITIIGTGMINFYLNDIQIFVIDLTEDAQITIDSENLEAFNKDTLELKNRLVTGDYDNLKLLSGTNKLSWSGTIEELRVNNYSRWL